MVSTSVRPLLIWRALCKAFATPMLSAPPRQCLRIKCGVLGVGLKWERVWASPLLWSRASAPVSQHRGHNAEVRSKVRRSRTKAAPSSRETQRAIQCPDCTYLCFRQPAAHPHHSTTLSSCHPSPRTRYRRNPLIIVGESRVRSRPHTVRLTELTLGRAQSPPRSDIGSPVTMVVWL